MTAYEIIMVFLGILALLIPSEASSLRCLPFSIREISENKNAYPVGKRDRRCS